MLFAFFWVILRRLSFVCRRFGTLCLFHLHRRYEDGTECSETSAYKIQTPGNYPEENMQQKTVSLLSSCEGRRNTIYEIRPNLSVTKQCALYIMTACLYSCLSYPAGKSHLFLRRVILSSEACLILTHLSTLSHKQYDFRKNLIEYELRVLIFSWTFVWYIS